MTSVVQEALAARECLLCWFPLFVSWVQVQVQGFVMMPYGSQAFLGSYLQGSWSGANASKGGGGNATPYLSTGGMEREGDDMCHV